MTNRYILNINKTSFISTPQIVGRVDDLPYMDFEFVFKDGTKPVDLTGASVEFRGLTSSGHKIVSTKTITITNHKGGKIGFTIPDNFYAMPGTFQRAYFVIKRNGRIDSTQDILVNVINSIDLNAEDADNVIDIVEDIVERVESIIDNVESDVKKETDRLLEQIKNNTDDAINKVHQQMNLLESSIDDLKGNLNTQVKQLQSELNSLKGGIEQTTIQVGELKDKLDELEGLIQDPDFIKREEFRLLQNKVSQNTNSINSINGSITTIKKNISENEKNINTNSSGISEVNIKVDNTNKEVNVVKNTYVPKSYLKDVVNITDGRVNITAKEYHMTSEEDSTINAPEVNIKSTTGVSNLRLFRDIAILGGVDKDDPKMGTIVCNFDSTSPFVQSVDAYNRTYSYASNMFVTQAGVFGRSTSAAKYKLLIEPSDEVEEKAFRVLDIKPAKWFDKTEVESIAENYDDLSQVEIGAKAIRHYGFIADEFHEAGLTEVVMYDENNEVDALAYDRISMYHNIILKEHQDRINELEKVVAELKKINNLD